ncbi:MAG: hypothetical protein AB1671_04470 [Thermodesulfobacteriota bacterium]|jgi:hypothetical protein
MADEKTLATIASSDPDVRLEVVLCTREAEPPIIELRRLSWGEGIGWFRQQTLRLEAAEAEYLLSTLRGNQRRWKPRPAHPHATKVIPFPRPADRQQGRAPEAAQRRFPEAAELSL